MTDDALKTLSHPFEAGLLEAPGRRALFLGARAGLRLPRSMDLELLAVQGFRPDVLALEKAGFTVKPRAEGTGYDLALVLLGRHRGQNEAWLREAFGRTREGGLVVAAGGKTEGADSLRKRFEGVLTPAGHMPKHHGVVFWFERPSDEQLATAPFMTAGPADRVDGRFLTAPGMFSHERIDPASKLLADNLPAAIKGRVADFGAGWGYLSSEILKRAEGLTALDLHEADFESLEAAKANLAGLTGDAPIGYHWRDLLQEPVARQYDLIVMNPPFHQGRAAEPAIGQGMIRAASAALKPGGRLMMVANRGMPYEPVLAAAFAATGETCRDDRFKVLWAKR
ncbi:class I SAM-dependent methyltransferase [Aquibium carbonis]|uniref:Class I SAM-dependent methyltransferase n=1 Tax=Aquibium carbonis TaxID=2495581 RepID=A0A429Z229_9HYPH|nr:class I SAM-dependent methyltransferase [Aquibium carbonis]RST87771.1 class I SAM-dependent methyltransferase [Aquibium carbonis]